MATRKKRAKKATKATKAGKKPGRKAARKARGGGKPAKVAAPPDLAQAFQASYTPVKPTGPDAVVLDPDIAPHFRDSRAVNEALRALLRIVRQVRS